MIRPAALSALALGLAACQPAGNEPTTPAEPPPPAAPSQPGPPVSAAVKLTAEGFGALRIGMSRAEVEAALGADSNPEAVGGPDPDSCDIFHPERAPDGLKVMVEDGVLTSVWLDTPATVGTERAFNVGDEAAAIKRAYGDLAEVEPHKYSEAPAEYITAWTRRPSRLGDPLARGVTYHIGTDGRVEHIAGGGPSIQYVEGCL